jgi:hypothetical protein
VISRLSLLNGANGSLLQNFGITHPSTVLYSALHSRPYILLTLTLGLFPHLNLHENNEVTALLIERQHFTDLLKDQLAKAQNRIKLHADANRTEHNF